MSKRRTLTRPLPAGWRREGRGHPAPGPTWRWGEAPRQRPGKDEPRRPTAGLPMLAWSGTRNRDGIPLITYTDLRSDIRSVPVEPNPLVTWERRQDKCPGVPYQILIDAGNHQGKSGDLNQREELPGTQESSCISLSRHCMAPAGCKRSQRSQTTLGAGKPSTWGRRPASTIRLTQGHGDQGESLGT